MKRLVLLSVALLVGCGGQPDPSSTPAKPTPPESAPAPAPARTNDGVARTMVRLVDLQGNPLPGMGAIATASPNAFDAPLAQSGKTDKNGEAPIELKSDQKLYVRGWDPDLNFFANNFFTILPSEGATTDTLVLVMVEHATLATQVLASDGTPVADTEVRVMLSHPTQGPWWPARTTTDAEGRATLGPLPPGQFNLAVSTAEKGSVELPATTLLPGETVVLDTVTLRSPS